MKSTNEEHQSTNEELETAKEELQSSNEELTTVNDELKNRNSDLLTLSGDLNNLLGSVEIPILIVGNDHRIRRFTPKAEKVFKLIASDVGRPLGDIKPSFDLDLDALISQVTESLIPLEKEIQDREGRWMRLQIRPYKTIDNRIDGAIIALVDIESLKQSLEVSEVALKYATSVADTVQLPFVVLDSDLRVKSANFSFYEYFRISPQTIGISFFEVLGMRPEQSTKLTAAIKETMISNTPFNKFEIDYDSKILGRRKLLLSGRQIHWIGAESQAMLIALEDLTERRRTEADLAQMLVREKEARNEAEKGNAAKDLFLATLSHELRTPLTTILSWAQMLRMGRLDAEKSKKGIEMIEQSAQAQGQLINDLLDVSRIIMGKLPLEMKELDPSSVIQSTIDSVRLTAEKKSIQIKTEFEPSIGLVSADPVRLRQVVWNLLTNAIKFSPQDGRVEVRLKRVQDGSSVKAQIQVIDYGKGVAPDFLPHIFDRFSQADSTSTRIHGGLGLGLAIVRNLVELQGGTVTAESLGMGKGATFTVNLPILSRKEMSETPEAASNFKSANPLFQSCVEHKLKGLRVLLVDDEVNARDALTVLLQSFGAEVRTASSADEALKLLPVFKPQVLVSDIAMPGEDGYSLIRKIRAMGPKHAQIPSLALTAYAGGEDVKRALEAGFQAHMAKPVDINKFAGLIAELSQKKLNE